MNSTVIAGALRVLLVEDSLPVRQRIRSLIEESGVVDVVGEAETIGDALGLYRMHRPDAVVLDLSLADGDGLQVLREIKSENPRSVVIVLTNNTTSEIRATCRRHGADCFFDKSREFECVPEVLQELHRAGGNWPGLLRGGGNGDHEGRGGDASRSTAQADRGAGGHAAPVSVAPVELELARLEALLNCDPNPVLELDENGAVTYCNAATWKLVQLLNREHPGKILPAAIATLVEACLADGKPVVGLEEQVDEHTLAFSFYPAPENRTVHCYASDITERKQLEQQFLHAQRMEAIGNLASGVAHDLNNILTPMLMVVGLLKDKLPAEEDQKFLALVETGARRGANIIRQLLMFSRGNEGPQVCVALAPVLQEMGQMMNETFPKNIELGQRVAADLWPVIADNTQLHQVLMNLCVNARDAMAEGGKLTLSATNTLLSEAEVRPHAGVKAGRFVMITISDTGQGIPPEIIGRIFDPFFTTKGVGKGTGLGLSTVSGIIKNHHGFVTVFSKPAWGTVFKVHLPAANETALPEVGMGTSRVVPGNNEKILIVDDEPPIREVMRQILEQNNYRVLVAASGEEAIKLFVKQAGEVRLVLTDINMPGMDGLALVRALRVMNGDIRVIVCSGSDHFAKQDEYAALGVTEVLAKPFVPARLLDVLQRALSEKI